jgi:hypothetical protein
LPNHCPTIAQPLPMGKGACPESYRSGAMENSQHFPGVVMMWRFCRQS